MAVYVRQGIDFVLERIESQENRKIRLCDKG